VKILLGGLNAPSIRALIASLSSFGLRVRPPGPAPADAPTLAANLKRLQDEVLQLGRELVETR
jgi:hypothetical protein